MEYYRITKYDPSLRNDIGHYLFDHWTEISDVGRTLESEKVTKEMYLSAESDYINAVIKILKSTEQGYLRLVGFDKKTLDYSLKENGEEWYHLSEFEQIELFEDKKISLENIPIVCQLNFRNYCHMTLEIKDKYYVHFGYDMYLYIGVPSMSMETINEINATSVFIEDCYSPYYYENLEYVVQRSKKRSKYVLDEKIIDDNSVEQMKKVLNLSEEHPGIIQTKIDRRIAKELKLEVDFSMYDYFLRSENMNE